MSTDGAAGRRQTADGRTRLEAAIGRCTDCGASAGLILTAVGCLLRVRLRLWLPAACCLLLASACRQDMHDQPKLEPLESSSFFSNGASARPQIPGTIARGWLNEDEHLHVGKVNGEPARFFPFEITEQVLRRGHERYDVFCSPCHSRTGYGEGMVVRRGFVNPPSLHTDDLRFAPPGHIFEAITNGTGEMPDYAEQIPVQDRWAIVAYIRALQFSQNADITSLPQEDRDAVERSR